MNKRTFPLFFLYFTFFIFDSFSQTPSIDWLKCYGTTIDEEGASIIQSSDGSYIVAGNQYNPSVGFSNIYLIKVTEQGNLVWTELKGGSNHDYIYDFEKTSDGGYIMTGETMSIDGDVVGNNGNLNTWVVKMDASMNIEWQSILIGQVENFGKCIQQTNDGGYILTGHTDGYAFGSFVGNIDHHDLYVTKLNSTGQTQWIKFFGGSMEERVLDIHETADLGFQILATTYSSNGNSASSNGATDFLVIKIDQNGNLVWNKCIGDITYENACSMIKTDDNGSLIIGLKQDPNSSKVIYLVKLNSDGIIQWDNYYGAPDDNVRTIIQTIDGGYLLGADKMNSIDTFQPWIVKLDANGSIQGQDLFTGSTTDTKVVKLIENQNGGYMLLGVSTSYSIEGITTGYHWNGTGSWDILLISMNQSVNSNELENNEVFISPNPSEGVFQINISETLINSDYIIYDQNGKSVEYGTFSETNNHVSLNSLMNGVYFLRVDQSGLTFKIVKI